jgi:hypothetical protein
LAGFGFAAFEGFAALEADLAALGFAGFGVARFAGFAAGLPRDALFPACFLAGGALRCDFELFDVLAAIFLGLFGRANTRAARSLNFRIRIRQ